MTHQSLMPFEAATVAAEAAKCEAQRAAEQHEREAKQAAKILANIQREKRKAEEEIAKNHRRFQRASAHKYRTPDEHAQCGIRWYCRSQKDRDAGTYWKNCHACGQPLIYTTDRDAKPQICAGRKS
ncbi:MAG: hypothetical protein ACXWIU_04665 [Limisphaerales bacterium]